MSFILDALKKSESERHRQTGPVLMDVRIAPPRRRIPPWAWVIAAVLVVNIAVLAWVLWLSPNRGAAPVQAAAPANVVTPSVVAPNAAAPNAAAPSAASPAPAATAATQPAPAALPAPPPVALPAAPPVAPPAAATSAATPDAAPAQNPAQQSAPGAAGAPAVISAGVPENIDVTTLPKVADMIAAGVALPEMQLSWHVYDARPQGRYVLLNGTRLREGELTPDGVRVVAIAPTGVVLEWRGRRMFLNAGR